MFLVLIGTVKRSGNLSHENVLRTCSPEHSKGHPHRCRTAIWNESHAPVGSAQFCRLPREKRSSPPWNNNHITSSFDSTIHIQKHTAIALNSEVLLESFQSFFVPTQLHSKGKHNENSVTGNLLQPTSFLFFRTKRFKILCLLNMNAILI